MNKIYLSLILHNHQPVGNYDFVIADAYQKAYEPMLAALEKHPAVRAALHYSGPLREWLTKVQPDFIKRVRTLVGRKQIEILTAVTTSRCSPRCRRRQAGADHQNERSGPQGFSAWNRSGCGWPSACGSRICPRCCTKPACATPSSTIRTFKYGGYVDDDLFGHYVTEEQGHPIHLFSSLQYLRLNMPWGKVGDIIEWLRQAAAP